MGWVLNWNEYAVLMPTSQDSVSSFCVSPCGNVSSCGQDSCMRDCLYVRVQHSKPNLMGSTFFDTLPGGRASIIGLDGLWCSWVLVCGCLSGCSSPAFSILV